MRSGNIENSKLRAYIERIEKLEEEKANIASDVRDVYAEAKSNGFDNKTMRKVLKLRKQNHNDRLEEQYTLDLYLRALNMTLELDEAV